MLPTEEPGTEPTELRHERRRGAMRRGERGDVLPSAAGEAMMRPAGAQVAFARLATALAVMATGALAIGLFAIGRLAIGRLAIGRSHVRKLVVDELEIGHIHLRAPRRVAA